MNNQLVPVITIDGPSGTGKGTLCHMLARHLGWHVLDSGAIYRVLAHAANKAAIDFTDAKALADFAKNLKVRFVLNNHDLCLKIDLDAEEITDKIRTEQCGQNASKIATYPEVRQALLARQRTFAQLPGLVTDGRDMGTVVFPEASLKLFLSASPEIRAKRRYFQLKEKQINVSLAEVIDELAVRDKRDTERRHAPLKPAKDAVFIDTTGLDVVQVFNNVLKLIKK
ncbi:MAG: cytidylate kinase [Legionellaceae bacterium]|nr:cytidylate kinase [Legionellaceae bacterium]HCA88801.1 (d)CMP kinase [Legionellales bacterium]|tara:strand:- start:637 stop:1314 length:678 start_codon:yes stop_codon:yes gene_type:complete